MSAMTVAFVIILVIFGCGILVIGFLIDRETLAAKRGVLDVVNGLRGEGLMQKLERIGGGHGSLHISRDGEAVHITIECKSEEDADNLMEMLRDGLSSGQVLLHLGSGSPMRNVSVQ